LSMRHPVNRCMMSSVKKLRRLWRRCLFHGLRGIAQAVRRWRGFPRLHSLGRLLGDLQYLIETPRRQRYKREIATVLGRAQGDPDIDRILRTAYRAGTQAALEILALANRPLSVDEIHRACHVEHEERLRSQLDSGRPVILLNNHMGNSFLTQLWLASHGYPVSVVYRESRKFPPGFFKRLFKHYGIEGIKVEEGSRAYRQMLKAVRSGRVLCIIMDQGTKLPGGVPVRFLGKDMDMPLGPAQLVRHADAVILPVSTLEYDPEWRFAIEEPVPLDRESPIEEDVRRLTRVMESQIIAHPHLWTWHHRRWRHYPLASDQNVAGG